MDIMKLKTTKSMDAEDTTPAKTIRASAEK